MNWGESVFCHGSVLVIINDLRVIDVAIAPFKTKAPLVVDANTVRAFTVIERESFYPSWSSMRNKMQLGACGSLLRFNYARQVFS